MAIRRLREIEKEKLRALTISSNDERLAKFLELASEAYQLERLISQSKPDADS